MPMNTDKLQADLNEFNKRISSAITAQLLELATLPKNAGQDERDKINQIIDTLRLVKMLTPGFVAHLKMAIDNDSAASRQDCVHALNQIIDKLVEIDAFRRDTQLVLWDKGLDLWSKCEPFFASRAAAEGEKLILESSFAGNLFNNLSWGAPWTDTTPMKAFWSRMSEEAVNTSRHSQETEVNVHLLNTVPKNTFFRDAEWPVLSRLIKDDNEALTALNLNFYDFQEDPQTGEKTMTLLRSRRVESSLDIQAETQSIDAQYREKQGNLYKHFKRKEKFENWFTSFRKVSDTTKTAVHDEFLQSNLEQAYKRFLSALLAARLLVKGKEPLSQITLLQNFDTKHDALIEAIETYESQAMNPNANILAQVKTKLDRHQATIDSHVEKQISLTNAFRSGPSNARPPLSVNGRRQ